jgi:nucleoside-diphosphate-sugar epimerase
MTQVLIFGASGFIGRALIEQFRRQDGMCVTSAPSGILRQSNIGPIAEAIDSTRPDVIVQATGITRYEGSDFDALYEGNVMPTIRLASALQRLGRRDAPVYALGSAAELGPTIRRAGEDYPCDPHTDYGRSKWLQTLFARAKNRDGFAISILRLFNVVGTGMSRHQVPRCFVDSVARGDSVLRTRALTFERDYIDVHTVADAICSLVAVGWRGDVLHLCTGQGTTARQLIDEIFRQSGRTVPIEEHRQSAGEYHCVGAPTALEAFLGRSLTWSAESCIRTLLSHH